MFKANFDFIYKTLNEFRVNLLSYKNIHSFMGVKLDDSVVLNIVKDIDDFVSTVKEMFKAGDVFIEIHNNSEEPRNNAGINVKYLKLLDHTYDKENVYWVMTAVNANKLNIVDLHNLPVYTDGSKLFVCEVHYFPLTKGFIQFNPAKFSIDIPSLEND